jgi:hypothetical protein
MDFRNRPYSGAFLKTDYRIRFWLYSEENMVHITSRTERVFLQYRSVSIPLTRMHWACHGSEVTVMPFFNCAQEIWTRLEYCVTHAFPVLFMLFCKLCVIQRTHLFVLTQTRMENREMARHLRYQVCINAWKINQTKKYFHRLEYRSFISYCVTLPSP